ncbi:serine endoprotease [Planctomycetes bacterium CA13]|uniref:Serine endoprotease n=1 Tax=Novipirellula herctigrandis TaxID=2527986 RepID=A0A5C5YXH2_9BACT|nr:serine endoprotease [Planctomycetes bacterium CA13]
MSRRKPNQLLFSLFAIASAVCFSQLVTIDSAEAQLFPRLRARLRGQSQPQYQRPPQQNYRPPTSSYRSARPQQMNSPDGPELQRARPVSPNDKSGTTNSDKNRAAAKPDDSGPSILVPNDEKKANKNNATSPATLGIDVQPTDKSTTPGLPRIPGIEVRRVRDVSKVRQSGLEEGDVIVMLDGQATPNVESVREILSSKKVGDSIVARVYRGRRVANLTLPLIDEAAERQIAYAKPDFPSSQKQMRSQIATDSGIADFGVAVTDSPNERGAVVTQIKSQSTAELLGLKVGDRVISVGDTFTVGGDAFQNQIDSWYRDQPLKLQLVRNNRLYTLTVDPQALAMAKAKAAKDAKIAQTSGNSEAKRDNKTAQGKSSGSSVFSGIGSAIGGLFGGNSTKINGEATTTKTLPAPEKDSIVAREEMPKPAKAETIPSTGEVDALEFGDGEPIGRVSFEDLDSQAMPAERAFD